MTMSSTGKIVNVRAYDLTMKGTGGLLVFDTEEAAQAYADQRQLWYERRHLWCDAVVGEL